MKTAGRENVYYCDTDSMIVNRKGFTNLTDLMDETALGMLKLEETSNTITIHGAKDYEFGTIKKTKGVPRKAEKIGENSWKYLQFQGFITWLNEGATGPPKGWQKIKTRRTKYNKGEVDANGNVLPWRLGL